MLVVKMVVLSTLICHLANTKQEEQYKNSKVSARIKTFL